MTTLPEPIRILNTHGARSPSPRGGSVTQRNLAKKLGIALGLTNLYLKRLARKGYIKLKTVPPKRIKYYLTLKGFHIKGITA